MVKEREVALGLDLEGEIEALAEERALSREGRMTVGKEGGSVSARLAGRVDGWGAWGAWVGKVGKVGKVEEKEGGEARPQRLLWASPGPSPLVRNRERSRRIEEGSTSIAP